MVYIKDVISLQPNHHQSFGMITCWLHEDDLFDIITQKFSTSSVKTRD